MAFNIANFSANINRYGTLQTNKFSVEIPAPAIFGPTEVDRVMHMRAINARIPGIALDLQRVYRYGLGPEQQFPTNVNFTNIHITFIDTSRNMLWKRFSDWINRIFEYSGPLVGGEASYTVEYKTQYTSDVKIFIFDNDGSKKNTIVMKEAFPISISEIGVSWSENNRLYEFTVGFAFREWYYDDYTREPASRIIPQPPGAEIGPALSSAPTPPPTESPRPPRSGDPFGLNATPGNETGTAGPANYSSFNF